MELLATCIASPDLVVDEGVQVGHLLLDMTKDHLSSGEPVEAGIELGVEHSLGAPGGKVAVKGVEFVPCHGPKPVVLRASDSIFLGELHGPNVVVEFVGKLKLRLERLKDSGVPFSHITQQPITDEAGPLQPVLIVGVLGGGTLDSMANDSQEIDICKGELNLDQPVLETPDTGRLVAGGDLDGLERWQVICLSWSWGEHRVDG